MPKKGWALIIKYFDADMGPLRSKPWDVHTYDTKTKLQRTLNNFPDLATKYQGQIVRRSAVDTILKLLNG